MAENDILRLLDETKELLGRLPSHRPVKKLPGQKSDQPYNYSTPVRKTIVLSFLVPADFSEDYDDLVHLYGEAAFNAQNYPYPKLEILHGHEKGTPCAAPHFCHHYRYRPENTCSPSFVQQFYLKWRKLYTANIPLAKPSNDVPEFKVSDFKL